LIRSGVFARGAGVGLVAVAALLQGCAQQQQAGAPLASGARLYAADQEGAARSCTAKAPALADGRETAATMAVGNDGGWCAISVDRNGAPYSAGLLMGRPAHGKVLIHTVGDATRIDYTPAPGYAGADSFTAQLLPGQALLRVAVTVTR
jgi:hypothetical protein